VSSKKKPLTNRYRTNNQEDLEDSRGFIELFNQNKFCTKNRPQNKFGTKIVNKQNKFGTKIVNKQNFHAKAQRRKGAKSLIYLANELISL